MTVRGPARQRVARRLEREALDETRRVLRDTSSELLDRYRPTDPMGTYLTAYLPAGQAARTVLDVFVRRIERVQTGEVVVW